MPPSPTSVGILRSADECPTWTVRVERLEPHATGKRTPINLRSTGRAVEQYHSTTTPKIWIWKSGLSP
ncbi:hypothetical protein F441_09200 [Phytophthora nicotianae CJ01A1]|uniref:Uncharacterized protein n=1 Tax=Phytophthora nicotianae CJ01A1 TaxID=1317063 RepID=W2X1A8_PHYNI|nr:hypothetical protein F441_09200 [Phytophthora nicotianae CJ01A1]